MRLGSGSIVELCSKELLRWERSWVQNRPERCGVPRRSPDLLRMLCLRVRHIISVRQMHLIRLARVLSMRLEQNRIDGEPPSPVMFPESESHLCPAQAAR